MSYQEVYKQKLTTADEAVKAVKSGDWVDYGWSVCSADALDKALARRMGELTASPITSPCGILSCRGITATASRAWTWPCSRWPPWTSTAGSISVPAAPT